MRQGTRLLAALAVTAGLAAGCGGGDDDSDSGSASQQASGSEQPASLAITATDQGLQVPAEVAPGVVEVELTNEGERPHEAQLVRIEGDHTTAELVKTLSRQGGPIPDWIRIPGGTGVAAPGQTDTSTVELEPGKHVAIDMSSRGKPATAEFEVAGEPSDAELPSVDAEIVADEFSFETSGLQPGTNRFEFRNAGDEPHHAIAVPMRDGATIDEVTAFFESEGQGQGQSQGPPPVAFGQEVGTAVIEGGKSQIAELELEQGRYALVCFIQNRAGGPPHVALGMVDELEVGGS